MSYVWAYLAIGVAVAACIAVTPVFGRVAAKYMQRDATEGVFASVGALLLLALFWPLTLFGLAMLLLVAVAVRRHKPEAP